MHFIGLLDINRALIVQIQIQIQIKKKPRKNVKIVGQLAVIIGAFPHTEAAT